MVSAIKALSTALLSAFPVLLSSSVAALTPVPSSKLAVPPVAEIRPHNVTIGKVKGENRGPNPMDPGVIHQDDYYWLRDDNRSDPDVLAYLAAENAYSTAMMEHLKEPAEQLYKDYISRIQLAEDSIPSRVGNYLYFTRTTETESYEIYLRKPVNATNGAEEEEVLLDVNEIAKGRDFVFVDRVEANYDQTVIAYLVDFDGDFYGDIFFKNLTTGELHPDFLKGASSYSWDKKSNILYYTSNNEANRSYRVWRHVLGTQQNQDELLYEEKDPLFRVSLSVSRSERFLTISVSSKETSEVLYLDLEAVRKAESQQPSSYDLKVFQPRVKGLKYSISHQGEKFYILTNKDGALNNRIMVTSRNATEMKYWREVVPPSKERVLRSFSCKKTFCVAQSQQEGFFSAWILEAGKEDLGLQPLTIEDPTAGVYTDLSSDYDDGLFLYFVSSAIKPSETYEYDTKTKTSKLIQGANVPNYNPDLYTAETMRVTARDGAKVPLWLIYRKDMKRSSAQPLILYGYGAYGSIMSPAYFEDTRIPLLDRGVIFAAAQVRGGSDMGSYWYEEQGKYLQKKNTFYDFIDCAEHLIKQKYTSPSQLAIEGASAGGLLVGAVVNMRPELFKAALAAVPFVDVLVTMSDPSIPLTIGEWEEWGNPNEEKFYEYIKSYSPIDNVRPQSYPAMLVTGGLNDKQVAYWEPAKWVAKLRRFKTDNNPLLLKINMEAGHGGTSDRFGYYRESALEQAFILEQIGAL